MNTLRRRSVGRLALLSAAAIALGGLVSAPAAQAASARLPQPHCSPSPRRWPMQLPACAAG